jgi:Nif-specific regulatory protein
VETVPAERHRDRPSVLLAIGDLLRSEVDVDRLLARIVDLIVEAMDADRATLFLTDPRSGELYSKVAHLPELPEIRLKPGQGVAGQVAATGTAITIRDAQRDRRFFGEVDRATGYLTQTLLCVPVRERQHDPNHKNAPAILGVIEVLNKRSGGSFDDDDLRLLEQLAAQVADALSEAHLDRAQDRPGRYNKIVGESPVIRKVYDVIAAASATDATVLVRGESGTGKELAARAIHVNSPRARGPFVKVDCTTIPEGLMESELFGHERGSFTGADRLVQGKVEIAAGGTLFLDEIGELPAALQMKLLRFLQDREFERVGGRRLLRADVRLVAATHRDLETAVRQGGFRQDLYYRLKVVELHMPALRDRGREDIERLAQHFLNMYARKHGKSVRHISPEARAALCAHSWPGNIRELEHCIESAVVFSGGTELLASHVPLPQPQNGRSEPPDGDGATRLALPSGLTLAEVERRYIARTLEECAQNRSRAAELLGIGRNTLVRKIKEYGL